MVSKKYQEREEEVRASCNTRQSGRSGEYRLINELYDVKNM